MSQRRLLTGAHLDPPTPVTSYYQDLDPVPRSTSLARRFVAGHLPDVPEETEDAALLLTSELVTNAVIHARTPFEVAVLITDEAVVVAVYDLDLASALQEPYPVREGGWGLGLVAALSQSWATTHHREGGKTMWFRLLRTTAPATVADGAAARPDADRRDR